MAMPPRVRTPGSTSVLFGLFNYSQQTLIAVGPFAKRRNGADRAVCFADAIKSGLPCHSVDRGCFVGWCDGWFCGGCDVNDSDVEDFHIDGGSSQESVGHCDIEFTWCEDMVKNGFVCLVPDE